MNGQIDSAIKHVRAYWFIDGFAEMAAGGFLALLAVLLLLRGTASPAGFSGWFLSMAGEIALAKSIGILVAILIVWWLKDHFTYPRTGFVRGNRVSLAQILVILRNLILFLLVPIWVLLEASLLVASAGGVLSSVPIWFPVSLGLLWAVLLALAGEWMGIRRFWILAGLILLSAIIVGAWQLVLGLPIVPASVQQQVLPPAVVESITRTLNSLALLLLVAGLVLLFSGLLTFLRYRKENPLPYMEDA